MRGYVTDRQGRAGLRLTDDLPEPNPAPNELVLDVRAYSINPGEVSLIGQRSNGWRPGQDVAGVVSRAAANGSAPPEGARVVARANSEGWADRVAVPVSRCAELDDRVSFEQAATLPIAGLTALRALRTGGAVPGRNVLVTGATGGVGQFAVQLAVLSGARVTAQVSRREREPEARALGAHEVVTSLDSSGLGPFHLVLDGVGGPQLARAVQLMAPEGIAALYGRLAGETQLSISDFYKSAWNGRVIGLVSELPEEIKGEDLAIIVALVAAGRLTPTIGWTGDWTKTREAFEALARRDIRGKAVLTRP